MLPWQIHVSLIEPDAIATPIWTKIASRARANTTPEGERLYGPIIPYLEEVAARAAKKGLPADHVAQAVVHALLASRPKTRYVVTKPM